MSCEIIGRPVLRALSIQQPWIWAILHCKKRVENRSWRPHQNIIGRPIALHASLLTDLSGVPKFTEILTRMREWEMLEFYRASPKAHGAIVAVAMITGWAEQKGDGVQFFTPDHDRRYGRKLLSSPWASGPVCWGLSHVEILRDPIPCSGQQRLWSLPPEVQKKLMVAEITR